MHHCVPYTCTFTCTCAFLCDLCLYARIAHCHRLQRSSPLLLPVSVFLCISPAPGFYVLVLLEEHRCGVKRSPCFSKRHLSPLNKACSCTSFFTPLFFFLSFSSSSPFVSLSFSLSSFQPHFPIYHISFSSSRHYSSFLPLLAVFLSRSCN